MKAIIRAIRRWLTTLESEPREDWFCQPGGKLHPLDER